jgi:putative ABC transport system permease protein
MLKSYFTMAWRRFLRNKVTSIINIGGLMLGLTTGIIICLLVVYTFGFDKFHTNYKSIHLLEMNQNFAGTIYTGNWTPAPLGPILQKEVPVLKYVVRAREESQSLTAYGDKAIYQKGMYAEPDFFRMMTYPAIEGDPIATLQGGRGVVLTERAARRLFGNGPALGKTVPVLGKTILLNNTHPLNVGAVIRDVPENSSVEFDIVMPYALFEKDNEWVNQWENRSVETWVQLRPGANLESVNRLMTQLLLTQLLIKHVTAKQVSLFAYPITRLNLYDNFKDGRPYWGKAYLIIVIAFIAFLTLLIACINFMNLSTAMAERRAREVGLRKVLGASRRLIIGQFLGEALLLAMVALVLSIGLAWLVLPWLAAFSRAPLYKEIGNGWVWALLVSLGILTGLMAGSYPALYLSRFQPAKVLKRLMSVGRNGAGLRKGLVSFQFVISIFLVVTTIVLVKQVHYVSNRPLGYETSNLIDITADGSLPGRYELFKNEVENIPGVLNLTASTDNVIGIGNTQLGLDWPGKRPEQDFIFQASWVQYDWTKTAGLKLAEGRDFSPAFGADSSACLINQTAARRMGLKEPIIGTRIGGKTVIGVLRDFVFNLSGKATQPLVVYLGKEGWLGHFLVRLSNDGQWKAHLGQIEKTVRSLNPGYPFTCRFVDDEHQEQFKNDFGMEQLANVFAVMAILISCLGLFGLASFLVEKRTREISIRKVLGASPAGLWLSLSTELLKPVCLGIVVATPLAAMAMSGLLSISDYHIRLSWWIFGLAGAGAILVALATVSWHGVRAARINPGRNLQTE